MDPGNALGYLLGIVLQNQLSGRRGCDFGLYRHSSGEIVVSGAYFYNCSTLCNIQNEILKEFAISNRVCLFLKQTIHIHSQGGRYEPQTVLTRVLAECRIKLFSSSRPYCERAKSVAIERGRDKLGTGFVSLSFINLVFPAICRTTRKEGS